MSRFLVLKPFAISKLNGGEIALMERLSEFKSWGHEIFIQVVLDRESRKSHEEFLERMKTPLREDAYELMGLKIQVKWGDGLNPHDMDSWRRYEEIFQKTISDFKPEIIFTHYTDFFATATALQWDPERTWVDQSDDEYPRLQQMQNFGRLADVYSKIKHMTVASPFLERSVKKAFPKVETHLCLNRLSNLNKATAPDFKYRNSGYWMHINPTAVKGIDFVLALAERMPAERFLLVGNWGSKFPDKLPANVTTIERQEDLSEVFSQAKGLLVPSVWQEAFGRVPLEAMAYGVPVITSDRGALPDTVGQGGIVLPLDLDLWEGAMRQSESYWKHQVAAGWKRFSSYQDEVKQRYAALRDDFSMLK